MIFTPQEGNTLRDLIALHTRVIMPLLSADFPAMETTAGKRKQRPQLTFCLSQAHFRLLHQTAQSPGRSYALLKGRKFPPNLGDEFQVVSDIPDTLLRAHSKPQFEIVLTLARAFSTQASLPR
jgi:hypothetical protein